MIHSRSQRLAVIRILSLMIRSQSQRLVVIYDISPQAIPYADLPNAADRLDVEIEIDEITLLARKGLDGTYQTARSIDEYAHVVTSSTLDPSSSLDQMLNPFNEGDFPAMNVTEYRLLPRRF